MNNIFVGNLSFEAKPDDVKKLFESYGTVARAVIMERKKGKSRGYGFVDMPHEEEKNKAIEGLNGKEFMGRELSVSVVIPKEKKEFKPKKSKPVQQKWDEPKTSKPWVKHEGKLSSWFNEEDERPRERSSRDERLSRDSGGYKKPYKRDEGDSRSSGNSSYGKKSWGHSKSSPRSSSKPYRRDDRDNRAEGDFKHQEKPWGKSKRAFEAGSTDRGNKPFNKNKDDSKAPYKKSSGYSNKSWPKSGGGAKPARKPGSAFRKFFNTGRPPKAK